MPMPIIPRMRIKRRLSRKAIKELAVRYKAGESFAALSREVGVSSRSLRTLLEAEGVVSRGRGVTPKDAEKARRLYESGHTIMQVANNLGYSYGAINKMLHDSGVPVRPRRHQEKSWSKESR